MTDKTDTIGQSDSETQSEIKQRLLDAALLSIAFDGWSEATFRAACKDTGIELSVAQVICPRGAFDLAMAYHKRGDALMMERIAQEDFSSMRLRERIARAIRIRIEVIDDKEAVRRGTALFSLPQHAGDGARALWGTVDAIWNALGDTADDINWYTKRASLSGVYGATVLFWLGDTSDGSEDTWAFMERRVDGVLNLEKARAQVTENPILKRVFAGPNWLAGKIRAPSSRAQGFPGSHAEDAASSTSEPEAN